MKKLAALLLAAALVLGSCPAAAAAEDDAPERPRLTVRLRTAEDLAAFSERCALEEYSLGAVFSLEADVDLTGTDFAPVPYFAGTFLGNGHSILGLELTGDGSRMGLFRRVAEGAEIRDVHVRGRVTPGGSRLFVGGLAGVSAGMIADCSFEGTVAGLETVGGLVGLNDAGGSVTGCSFAGEVTAEKQSGGIAGRSLGLVQQCRNDGAVNTVLITPERESSFDISAFTQEDFLDLADIGGIVGENLGVIDRCVNSGAVGYANTGYNVGGVVGKTSGFVTGCENRGDVRGRRDVGGIAGQLIPYAAWDLSDGRLDELRSQLNSFGYLLSSASRRAGDLDGALGEALDGLDQATRSALEQLNAVLAKYAENDNLLIDRIQVDPVTGEITLRDVDLSGIDTAALTAALGDLVARSLALSEALKGSVGSLSAELRELGAQASRIMNGTFSALQAVGASPLVTTRDLSAGETYDHDLGALDGCRSTGAVAGETNVGGVAGAVGFEISFDMENRLNAGEVLSSNAEQSLFAAIRRCAGYGEVSARGDCAGGVVGSADMGAVDGCAAAGSVTAGGAYAGGVAGKSGGTVRLCWARTFLRGEKNVGGAVGLGKDILQCRVWPHIDSAREYAGAVAGWAEGTVEDNLYVSAPGLSAGVDGVSLTGQCAPVDEQTLLSLEDVPESFGDLTVTFMGEKGVVREISVPFGGSVEELPPVENDGERYWKWDEADLSRIYYNVTVTGRYYAPGTTLSSGEEIPMFLVEGVFYEGQELTVARYSSALPREELLGAYTLRVNGYEGELTVRMRTEDDGALYRVTADGSSERLSYRRDGRYIVFPLENGGSFVYAKETENPLRTPWLPAGAAVVAAVIVVFILRKKKKRPDPGPTDTKGSDKGK